MTTIDEAAALRKEDEHDAQERGASREEFGAVPDVPLAGDECGDVGEYNCAECKGHNRCEHEMNAGHGDYGRDDPREDR